MFSIFSNTFSVIEWLAVTGLAQGVLILVYIILRVRKWRQASLALAYFFVLSLAFGLQFSLRLEDYEETIRMMLWLSRSMGPPLCYLLVLQIAEGVDMPGRRQFWILALVPLSLVIVFMMRNVTHACDAGDLLCPGVFVWLYWMGSIAGGVTMLALWGHKNLFAALRKAKGGHERYWLVIMLIVANVMVVGIYSLRSTGNLTTEDADALFVVMGLAFSYLATTALFRVYPLPLQLSAEPTRFTLQILSAEETQIADKVRKLMDVDKLYHEATFSRAALAQEIGVSENTLSRVINVAFSKSFPRMLSEYRVEDAKRMLHDSGIPIQVVAFEVGFNSLASFNRAFREVTGKTPTEYRQAHCKPQETT